MVAFCAALLNKALKRALCFMVNFVSLSLQHMNENATQWHSSIFIIRQ